MANLDFTKSMWSLNEHHIKNCNIFSNFAKAIFSEIKDKNSLNELPYLPVRAFKEFDILSIDKNDVFKTMNSSGTTGTQSKIYLDKETAKNQSSSLIETFTDLFGNKRFPMLIIDSEKTVKDRAKFSARTAAINGFSLFSRNRCFALDDNLNLNLSDIESFLQKHDGQTIFIFGFTFVIWNNFINELSQKSIKLPLKDSFLLHGGGWKKLEAEKVSNARFKELVFQTTGCRRVHNYYGMVEQTGSIYFECEMGKLHAPKNGDVSIRSIDEHKILDDGEVGLIQLFSNIQRSYPGHSILTEDLGRKFNGNICKCGNTGSVVEIVGRLKKADIRGCSDAIS